MELSQITYQNARQLRCLHSLLTELPHAHDMDRDTIDCHVELAAKSLENILKEIDPDFAEELSDNG